MVLVFISTHASGPNYQGCIVLYDELEFDIQSELKNLRRAMDDVSNRLNSHPIPLIVFSQVFSPSSDLHFLIRMASDDLECNNLFSAAMVVMQFQIKFQIQ